MTNILDEILPVTYGFPKTLFNDVKKAIEILPPLTLNSMGHVVYILNNEEIIFPYRVYYENVCTTKMDSLSITQRNIIHCIYTRHHNGFIRQAHLAELFKNPIEDWFIPYIFKLSDEYIVEIIQYIYEKLSNIDCTNFKIFALDNINQFKKSYLRMISYWNEYYRSSTCNFKNYIGRKLFRECFGYTKEIQKK